MENKIKTAEEIVTKLAMSDEPYYHVGEDEDVECFCALCPSQTHEESDRVVMPVGHRSAYEDGRSIMGHVSGCAWRMAVEYVRAAGK